MTLPKPIMLPYRFLLSLIVGIALSFFIMFLWYATQPIVISVIVRTQQVAEDLGFSNSYVNGGITLLTWIEYWWGPILVVAICVIWLFLSTIRTDWEGKTV